MASPYLGEIRMFGFGFAPVGWLPCNGQTLSISQYAALFALLGTTYGGNGTSTFQLPNLQSRVPVNQGQGTGLSAYVLGEQTGAESVTLTSSQMPTHTHAVSASATATTPSPSGAVPAAFPSPRSVAATDIYAAAPDGTTKMNQGMIATAGGNQAHNNIQPVLCVNFCIATEGIFPSRS